MGTIEVLPVSSHYRTKEKTWACKLSIFLCLLLVGTSLSVKCYVGSPSDASFEEKECQAGLICAKLVVDGDKGCLPSTFGTDVCKSITTNDGTKEACLCDTDLCNNTDT